MGPGWRTAFDRSMGATLLAAVLIAAGGSVRGQSGPGPADDCSTARVFPFPVRTGDPLVVQVSRYCPEAGNLLEVQTSVSGNIVRVDTQCAATPLPLISCQTGQADLEPLAPGNYTLEVYDLQSGVFGFSETFSVGRVRSIPALGEWSIGVLAAALAGLGLFFIGRQAGRNRFSNKRS